MPNSHFQLRSRYGNQRSVIKVLRDERSTAVLHQKFSLNKRGESCDNIHSSRLMGGAEELQTGVMEIFKKKLGARHLHTLTSMRNLALIWDEQGRDEEANRFMHEYVSSLTLVGPTRINRLHCSRNFSTMLIHTKSSTWYLASRVKSDEEHYLVTVQILSIVYL